MTKAELLRFLEPYTDDCEILVNVGVDHNNFTKVCQLVGANYYNQLGVGEIWLKLNDVSLTRKTR